MVKDTFAAAGCAQSSSAARANGQKAIIAGGGVKRATQGRRRTPGSVPENRDPSGCVPGAAFAMGAIQFHGRRRVSIPCPGSGHMRRRGFFGCVFGKVLDRGMSAKGPVRSEGVEFIGEGVDPSVDVVEVVVGQVPYGVELASSGAVVVGAGMIA